MNFLDVLNTLTEDDVEFVIVGGVAALTWKHPLDA